ncbi:MAG: peptidyl-prolyl cis-trans isomerase [Holophaga sp.]|nr:peptidyl-prolyl cis-trans isomerase [Holophaga sp.]
MNLRGFAPFCLPCLILSAGEVREEILVVVNGHIITRREFQQAVEQGTAALYREFTGQELDGKLRSARDKILQGLVDSDVLGDKAADLGVVISDDSLRAYVDELKKQNNFTSDADFERALKGSLGIGLQTYLERSRQDLLKQEVLRREVFSKVAVDEQEMLAYYQEHRLEYRLPSRFRIRELVLSKGGTPEEQKDAETKLAVVQAELKKGTPFEALIKYSTAPSRSTEGDLGWLSRGVLRADLEQAALALKPGQVSAPITTDKDIYFIQLIQTELDKVKPFAEVRPAILAKLQEPKAQNAIETYIQSLRIRANIRYMVSRETILKG